MANKSREKFDKIIYEFEQKRFPNMFKLLEALTWEDRAIFIEYMQSVDAQTGLDILKKYCYMRA